MSAGDFQRCVEYEDATTLTKIPGVGKKTAERLIIEMRDRVTQLPTAARTGKVTVDAGPRQEAVDALIALGYKPAEVTKLVNRLDTDGQSAEDIIRSALRQVAS